MKLSPCPYPEYKLSGVEWLGDLPVHWSAPKFKLEATLQDQKVDGTLTDAEYVGLEHIESWTGRKRRTDRSSAESLVNVFHKGDILFGKLRPYLAKVLQAQADGVCSTEILVIRPTTVKSRFLFWLVISKPFVDLVDSSTFGARMPRADWDFIKGQAIPYPPLSEQRAIANFLDAMDEKITRFIVARRRMIALLEEQKQAIINQAVTRGLDPDVPLKPSGIDWLGDIPAHWEMRRGAALFTERNLTNVPELPILEVSLVSGVTVRDFENSHRKQVMSDRAGYKVAKEGDLPYNMMRMWQGAVGVAPTDGLVSPAYVVLAPGPNVFGGYFSLLFRTPECMDQFSGASRGIVSDRDRLYWESFRQISFAVPPTAEQHAIAKAVHESSRKIDLTAGRHRQEIDLIQEYRTRLISDVVTGRLDVHGVARAQSD